jgi:4-amino-4-deoxy-L-arabinose transferase-like glycosyltransferase
MLFRLVERLGGLRAAMIASAILLLDPYVIRINRRNMLETMAEMWVVAGLYFFWRERDRLNARSVLLIGLIFGLGLLTKELVIFGYGSLLVFTVLAGRWHDIKKVTTIGGIAVSVWTLFPFWAWSVGQWSVFVENKTYNLRRLLGQVHSADLDLARRARALCPGLGWNPVRLFCLQRGRRCAQ